MAYALDEELRRNLRPSDAALYEMLKFSDRPSRSAQMEAKLHDVIEKARASAKRFDQAAQHTRNRGLKVVLHTYAHRRGGFADALEQSLVQAGGEAVPAAVATADEPVRRGFADMAAVMTVQRQGRQRLLLREAIEAEQSLIHAYEDALENGLPPAMRDALEEQVAAVRRAQDWLARMSEPDGKRALFVRLFNRMEQGQAVIKELIDEGIARESIYAAPIESMTFHYGDEERRHPRREVLTATVITGLLIGLLLGLITSIGHYTFLPQISGFVFSTWPAIALEHLAAGALFGLVFGLVMGLFMGQDTVEDDAYLYDESLEDGEMLVAVFAAPEERERTERIIGLRHEFEVRPDVS
jgi:uncharacterized protein (TIGR02284 family)